MNKYNKDKIKNSLSIGQVFDLVSELGGEPIMNNGNFTAQTICHNHIGDGSRKLYYYDNTKLFRCYTECNDVFDIFELVMKVKNISQDKKIRYDENGKEVLDDWMLFDAIQFVAIFFGFEPENQNFSIKHTELQDWDFFNKYEENSLLKNKQIVELHIYDKKILKYLPRPRIIEWEQEGIKDEISYQYGICYDPHSNGIVIPHFDKEGQLIGIRERTLIKELEKNGKYKPAILNGVMYNHPLGFNLYNLNNSKDNIKNLQKVFIFESEKSCLKYASYFGIENDLSVAICGNSISNYQISLLKDLNVQEIIIALDKQYKVIGDEEWKRWTNKFYQIHNKYGKYFQISYMFDFDKYLDYKDSPIDEGKDVFISLYQNRIIL